RDTRSARERLVFLSRAFAGLKTSRQKNESLKSIEDLPTVAGLRHDLSFCVSLHRGTCPRVITLRQRSFASATNTGWKTSKRRSARHPLELCVKARRDPRSRRPRQNLLAEHLCQLSTATEIAHHAIARLVR